MKRSRCASLRLPRGRSATAIALFVGCTLATTAPTAQAQPATVAASTAQKVLEVRLGDNVFLVPDPYAKSVTGWLLIRAGCADEATTCNGLAHYLEHLLFINRDADHRSKVALFPSGNGNGWTSHTATGYLQSFPVQPATKQQNLDKLVGYLAGLLNDVRAAPEQADKERNIVLQEHLQRTGSPQARFGQKRLERLLPDDPLGRSVGGNPDTIKAFDIPTAVAYHQRWYAANNATFVFTGPVTADDFKPLVETHIKPLTSRALPARSWLATKPVTPGRDKLVETDKDITRPIVTYDKLVSYKEPADNTEQLTLHAARGVVASFLSSRRVGSPLHRLIDQNELIGSGSFGVQWVRPGLLRLIFQGSPVDGVTPERLAEAVKREVDTLKPEAITAAYLTRLKKRNAIGRELIAEEPSRYAGSFVGWMQSLYPYEAWLDRSEYDRRLELSHVREVLRTLAGPGREVVGHLLPQKSAEARKP